MIGGSASISGSTNQPTASMGDTVIAWVASPASGGIPHVRTYSVSTNTYGTDTPLQTSTTNSRSADWMASAWPRTRA